MTVMTSGNDTINILPLFRFARTHFWLKIHKNLHRHSIYDQFVRIGDRHEVMIMPDKADSGALCIVSKLVAHKMISVIGIWGSVMII